MGSMATAKIPQVNFSNLDLANPSNDEWMAVRSQVMKALENFSCVEVVGYDKITPELLELIFGKVSKEAFNLPHETKVRNNYGEQYNGYINRNWDGVIYEGLLIDKCTEGSQVDQFTTLMWGNTDFSEPIFTFTSRLKELDETITRMVFEAYGVEKYLTSHFETHNQSLRLGHYGPPKTEEPIVVFSPHTDLTLHAIVCQHEQEGLEVQTKDGSWIKPSRNALVFLVGNLLSAWSNGRLEPALHQVLTVGYKDRYATVYTPTPKEGVLVQAPKELIDDKHPVKYKPFHFNDYFRLRFSEAGIKEKYPLKAFFGTDEAKVVEFEA